MKRPPPLPPRIWFTFVLFLPMIAANPQALASDQEERVSTSYCRDFNPSISYLTVTLPEALVDPGEDPFGRLRSNSEVSDVVKLNLPPAPLFSQAGLRFALVANFVQQLAIGVLADEDPFIGSLQVMRTSDAVRDAMGFGIQGTRLREPGKQGTGFDQFSIEYVETEEPWIQSDASKTVFVTSGVVKNIVKSSLIQSFGSLEAYREFLHVSLGMSAEHEAAHDLRGVFRYRGDYIDPKVVPLGESLANASADGKSVHLHSFAKFAEVVVGKLLFVGAHEIGHDKLRHRESTDDSCESFRLHEREADEFAATVLADFNFSMVPDGGEGARLTDFAPFFIEYTAVGFRDRDTTTDCEYDPPSTRMKNVEAAYQSAQDRLVASTFGAPDYASPFPTDLVCRDGDREWRVKLR